MRYDDERVRREFGIEVREDGVVADKADAADAAAILMALGAAAVLAMIVLAALYT